MNKESAIFFLYKKFFLDAPFKLYQPHIKIIRDKGNYVIIQYKSKSIHKSQHLVIFKPEMIVIGLFINGRLIPIDGSNYLTIRSLMIFKDSEKSVIYTPITKTMDITKRELLNNFDPLEYIF